MEAIASSERELLFNPGNGRISRFSKNLMRWVLPLDLYWWNSIAKTHSCGNGKESTVTGVALSFPLSEECLLPAP